MLEVFLLFANAHTEKKTWGIYHIAFVPFFGLQDSVTLLTGLQGYLAKKFYEFILFNF